MGKKESENKRYLRTVMRPWVLQHLFNTLYSKKELTVEKPVISETDYNEKRIWMIGSRITVLTDDEFEQYTPQKYEINSISGMTELFIQQMHPSKKESTVSDCLRRISYSIKEEDQLIESKSKSSNSFRFYPKEDYPTLKKYLTMLYDTDNGDEFRKQILRNSKYYELMVNRQLILDSFKNEEAKIRINLKINGK